MVYCIVPNLVARPTASLVDILNHHFYDLITKLKIINMIWKWSNKHLVLSESEKIWPVKDQMFNDTVYFQA